MLRVEYKGTSSLFEYTLQEGPSTAIAILVGSTKFGETHFDKWVGRRPLYDIAKDPQLLSQFILADYLHEGLEYTKSIPCLNPLNKAVLLPVQFIAIAALLIECHEISQSIVKKDEDKEQEVSISDNPIWEFGSNVFSVIGNTLGIDHLLSFIPEEAKAACQQVVCEELPAQHELGMKKALIYYLLKGDSKAADQYALLYFRNNWEKVNQHGGGVLDRLIEYAQKTWLNQDFKVTEKDALTKLTAQGCLQSGEMVHKVLETLAKDPDLASKVPGGEKEKESKTTPPSTSKAEPQDNKQPDPPKQPVTIEQVVLIAASMGLIGVWIGRRLSKPIHTPAAA